MLSTPCSFLSNIQHGFSHTLQLLNPISIFDSDLRSFEGPALPALYTVLNVEEELAEADDDVGKGIVRLVVMGRSPPPSTDLCAKCTDDDVVRLGLVDAQILEESPASNACARL